MARPTRSRPWQNLAARYTVVCHDRRGFSRSQLDGPPDYDRRLKTDADDVWRLIKHLSHEPAIVFGSSSGGIVALELLYAPRFASGDARAVRAARCEALADGQKRLDFFSSTYDLYSQSGPQVVLHKFREQAFAESDRQIMARAMDHTDRAGWLQTPPTGSSTSSASIRQ